MDSILYFHHYNNFSGSTRVLANLLEDKVGKGETVSVITDNTTKGCLSDIPGINIINLPILRFKTRAIPIISPILWLIYGLFLVLLYGRRYKVFYINTIVPIYAAIGGLVLKKHIVYHVHEKFVNPSFQDKVSEWIFEHVKADRYYVSNYLMEQYKKKTGVSSFIKYNTLSNCFVKSIKRKPIHERSFKKILLVSSLSEAKGVTMFKRLANLMPEFDFILVISSEMNKIVDFLNNDIPDNIKIYSNQKDMHPFYYDADVLMNLTNPKLWVETFGMTILEGMAYGLPAIVPNIGGPKELVDDGINGFSVDVTNEIELCNAIKKCVNRDNYLMLSNNAIRKFEMIQFV